MTEPNRTVAYQARIRDMPTTDRPRERLRSIWPAGSRLSRFRAGLSPAQGWRAWGGESPDFEHAGWLQQLTKAREIMLRLSVAAVLAFLLLRGLLPLAEAQEQVCGPGATSLPGDPGNIYVTVERVQGQSFSGLSAFRAGGDLIQQVTAVVNEETRWVGDVQSLSDITVGDILQAVGRWQDDCSLRTTTVISPQTPPGQEDTLPQSGTGYKGGSVPLTPITYAVAAVGLLCVLGGLGAFLRARQT